MITCIEVGIVIKTALKDLVNKGFKSAKGLVISLLTNNSTL
jgi:hypothetical protein